jgi:hypothetical protein
MDIVETSTDWIEFDAETDEVPFLHMHDMIEVKHKDYNSHWKLVPLPAWSVDFDSSRYPVVAYRVIKKADVSEIEQLRKTLKDISCCCEGKCYYKYDICAHKMAANALKEKE